MRRSRSGRASASDSGLAAWAGWAMGMANAGARTSGIIVFAIPELYSGGMIERPTQRISVILQRETVPGRWESHRWDVHGVVPDVGGETHTILEDARTLQRLHPG